jgi:hypothetical protein
MYFLLYLAIYPPKKQFTWWECVKISAEKNIFNGNPELRAL